MFSPFGITILDPTMSKNEIRVIKNINEILGFKVTNEVGQHLFVEVKWNNNSSTPQIEELIIRTN